MSNHWDVSGDDDGFDANNAANHTADDIEFQMNSLSLNNNSNKNQQVPTFSEKKFNSLNLPHTATTQSQIDNEFLRPISVKSLKWDNKKINLNNLNHGPFNKYAISHSKNPIHKELQPPPVLPNFNESLLIKDEIEEITSKDLIKDLLNPKVIDTIEIKDSERKIKDLKVELMDHQVLGLKFLLQMEKVKPAQRTYLDLLYGTQKIPTEETDKKEDKNKIILTSDSYFNVGGILADDMGLGKTVQAIALILENRSKNDDSNKTTLIVCPAPLITQWCNEFEDKAPCLKILSFHGPKRPNDSSIVHKYDVVITSYQTLNAENDKSKSCLFDKDYPFRRVILDEAHTIKNTDTKANKSCCNIVAKRRWCLTGTPIQNKISELYGLLKFLGLNNYENKNYWNLKIGSLENNKKTDSSAKLLNRLHKILDKYMLRRTKSVLNDNGKLTVKKVNHTEILDFTPFERKLYNRLQERIINELIGSEMNLENDKNGILVKNKDIDFNYMGVLTYLLRLRQLCCHWEILFDLKEQYDDDLLMESIKDGLNQDENFDDVLSLFKNMTIDNDEENIKINSMDSNDTKNLKMNTLIEDKKINYTHSIKLKRILNILKQDGNKPRKTIIFSEFTSMLDILANLLFENNIPFVKYDGRMDKISKAESLEKLSQDPNIHVLLCSLKCGAYGLNITSCSRVILYEPFWNPAIGAQAVDRVYRYGQTKDVDVHEFYISETIEIRIKELQEQKKNIMNAVIDKDAVSAVKIIGNGLSKVELLRLLGINTID